MMKEETLKQCLEKLKIQELGNEVPKDSIVKDGIALVKKNGEECYVVVGYDVKAKGYAVTFDPYMIGGFINDVISIYSKEKVAKTEEKAPKIENNGQPEAKPKQQRGKKGKGVA